MKIKKLLVCKAHRSEPSMSDCLVNVSYSYYSYLLFHSLCIQNKDAVDEWSEMPSQRAPARSTLSLTQAPGAAPPSPHCGVGDISL